MHCSGAPTARFPCRRFSEELASNPEAHNLILSLHDRIAGTDPRTLDFSGRSRTANSKTMPHFDRDGACRGMVPLFSSPSSPPPSEREHFRLSSSYEDRHSTMRRKVFCDTVSSRVGTPAGKRSQGCVTTSARILQRVMLRTVGRSLARSFTPHGPPSCQSNSLSTCASSRPAARPQSGRSGAR